MLKALGRLRALTALASWRLSKGLGRRMRGGQASRHWRPARAGGVVSFVTFLNA